MQTIKNHPFIVQFRSSNSSSSASRSMILNYSIGLESFICSVFADESNRFAALLRLNVSNVTGSAYLQNEMIANLSVMGVELGNEKSSFFSMK